MNKSIKHMTTTFGTTIKGMIKWFGYWFKGKPMKVDALSQK